MHRHHHHHLQLVIKMLLSYAASRLPLSRRPGVAIIRSMVDKVNEECQAFPLRLSVIQTQPDDVTLRIVTSDSRMAAHKSSLRVQMHPTEPQLFALHSEDWPSHEPVANVSRWTSVCYRRVSQLRREHQLLMGQRMERQLIAGAMKNIRRDTLAHQVDFHFHLITDSLAADRDTLTWRAFRSIHQAVPEEEETLPQKWSEAMLQIVMSLVMIR